MTSPEKRSYTYLALPGVRGVLIRSTDNAFIPCDLANRDYQEFLSWVAEGNPPPAGWGGPRNDEIE